MTNLSRSDLKLWRRYTAAVAGLHRSIDEQLKRDAGMSEQEFVVLSALSDERSSTMRMTRLANGVFMSPSRLTHTIDRLERRGWVVREADPDDARVRLARLTGAGREILDVAWEGHSRKIKELFLDQVPKSRRQDFEEVFGNIERAASA